jgi:hypothetical protein
VHGYVEYADGAPASDIEIAASPIWWLQLQREAPSTPTGHSSSSISRALATSAPISCVPISRAARCAHTQARLACRRQAGDRAPCRRSPAIPGGHQRPLRVCWRQEAGQCVHIEAYSPPPDMHTSVGYDARRCQDTFVFDRLELGTYRLTFSGNGMEDKVVKASSLPTRTSSSSSCTRASRR